MGTQHGCRRSDNGTADGPLWGNGPHQGTRPGPGRRRPRGPSAGEEEEPPVGCVSAGRRQSRSLRQQSHPTRFVAGAGNLWRASTHKGSPMFRRRATARTTLGPRGLLTARLAASRREAPHGRSKTHRSREWRWARFGEQWPSRPVVRWRADGARAPLQKETCAGGPAKRGTLAPPPGKPPAWLRDASTSARLGYCAPLAWRFALACQGLERQRARAVWITAA